MAQGTQPNHYVTGKQDSVKTVASNKPTKEELLAQLQALTAQIQALE